MPTPAKTRGVHHVALTVPDLSAAERFFVEALGYQVRGQDPEYPATFVSDGTTLVALWQVKDRARTVAFDRAQNVGLHHFAIAVDGHASLDALYARIVQRTDAEVEFGPEPLHGGPTRHMMLRIGGGLRIELIAAGA
jgi:catechol 2,3-dioxygenase-like lactoylglutathione lyase family enzyme